MQKKHKLCLTATVAIVALLVACTPPQPTPPVTTPTSQTPVSSVATSAPTPATTEDVAWAKIVQDARKEGQVSIYSFVFAGDVGSTVSKAFRDKYGIKVDIVAGSSPILLERIRAEYRADQSITDIAEMSSSRVLSLKDDKLTVTAKELPVMKDKADWYTHPLDLDPDGHVLSYYISVNSPYINTTMVKAGQEPQSWSDLLQPQWKGKVMAGDPGVYIGAVFYYWGMTKKTNRLPEDYFRQLGGQIGRFVPGGSRDMILALVRGEGPLNIDGSNAGAAPLVTEGAPVKILNMKEGGVSTPATNMAILPKAPHPNAARLFANWFLSTEGMRIFAQAASQATLRKDVPDFSPAAVKVDLTKIVNLDFKDLDEVNKLYNAGFLTKLWKGEAGK